MMRAEVIGIHDLQRKLENLTPTLEEGFRKGLVRACLRLQKYIKGSKLSGQVLKNRTGTLRRSIFQMVEKDSLGMVGKVGTNVWYGAVHEFGGTVTVKAHMRTIKEAFGRKLKNPVTFPVASHSATYPQRSFLRSAYDEQKGGIMNDIKAEISIAAKAS